MSAAILIGFLFFCAMVLSWCSTKPAPDPRMMPVVNAAPQHFFTISGHVEPGTLPDNTVHFLALYTSTKEACRDDANTFEGASIARRQDHYLNVHPNNDGEYALKIPLDYYQPGFCDWQIRWVSFNPMPYKVENDGWTMAVFSSPNEVIERRMKEKLMGAKPPYENPLSHFWVDVVCKHPGDCTIQKQDSENADALPLQGQYTLQLNIASVPDQKGEPHD